MRRRRLPRQKLESEATASGLRSCRDESAISLMRAVGLLDEHEVTCGRQYRWKTHRSVLIATVGSASGNDVDLANGFALWTRSPLSPRASSLQTLQWKITRIKLNPSPLSLSLSLSLPLPLYLSLCLVFKNR